MEQDEEHDTIYTAKNRDTNEAEAVHTVKHPPEQKQNHKPTPLCFNKLRHPRTGNTNNTFAGLTDAARYTGPKARKQHNWMLTGNRWMCLQCLNYRYFKAANWEKEWHSEICENQSEISDKLLDNYIRNQHNIVCCELVDGQMLLYCTTC